MAKMISLTIDGKKVQAPEGTLIVDAAKKIGIDIPVFCYHPKMEPVGMCRMCLVEIGRPVIDRATGATVLNSDGSPKIQMAPKLDTACTTPVSEGMVVVGMSDRVTAARKDIIEFILTSHPLDCPICDKGGECPLQNLTMKHGTGLSRYLYDEKMRLDKHVPLGDLIFLDRERCIQCARCVRFQDEIVDEPVIGFSERGRSFEIITNSEPGFDSYFSGNTTDICPVGALTTADFRFGARPWEMRATASICSHCPVGCNMVLNVRREAKAGGEVVIKRAIPRQNEAVNEIWMCDKGRFAYQFTESKERLTQPLVRKDGELAPASWEEALDKVAARMREAGSGFLALAGGRLPNEDLFNLSALAAGVNGKAALYTSMAGGDLVAQVGVGVGTNFSDMKSGTTILVVASDLEEEAPIWYLRVKQAAERGAKLIVANPRQTHLDRYASQTLRYSYGAEAVTVLGMVNALSAKRPDLGDQANKINRSALKEAAEAFASAENAVILFGSEGLGLEGSRLLAQACANLLITTNHTGRPNNGLIGVWQHANDQGAWDMGLRPLPTLAATLPENKAILVAAADPAGDDPALAAALSAAVQAGALLVVQELFLTETARLAEVVLPVQAYTEREGTFTSGERRVQRFYPAVPALPGCKPDFQIEGLIAASLGIEMESNNAARVMIRIASKVSDYKELGPNPYRKLAETKEQWPIVGRSDMYYGGTGYENSQGLGVQISSAAERGELVPLGWIQIPANSQPANGLRAVPITRLYDMGQTVIPSKLLHSHIGPAYIVANPGDIKGPAEVMRIKLNEVEKTVQVRLDESLEAGVILVPRSMGLPIGAPSPVELFVETQNLAALTVDK